MTWSAPFARAMLRLLVRPDRRDHGRAERLQPLHHDGADAARRGVDEDRVARLHRVGAADEGVDGEPLQHRPGRDPVRDVVGQLHDPVRREHPRLGVRARPRDVRDPVAGADVRDAGADRLDDARRLDAEPGRQRERVEPAPVVDVDVVHADRALPDAGLARRRARPGSRPRAGAPPARRSRGCGSPWPCGSASASGGRVHASGRAPARRAARRPPGQRWRAFGVAPARGDAVRPSSPMADPRPLQVSGFTFVRNAIKYDYPIVEAVESILPLCDEVVVAVGRSEDDTLDLVRSIPSPKVRDGRDGVGRRPARGRAGPRARDRQGVPRDLARRGVGRLHPGRRGPARGRDPRAAGRHAALARRPARRRAAPRLPPLLRIVRLRRRGAPLVPARDPRRPERPRDLLVPRRAGLPPRAEREAPREAGGRRWSTTTAG